MYRQIFVSKVDNLTLNAPNSPALISDRIAENRKKREEMSRRYSMDLSDFKFNRDEANDYE